MAYTERTIPKMKTMRIDVTESSLGIKINMLVCQETNKMYYSKIFNPKDKIRSIYSEFKYLVLNELLIDFIAPGGEDYVIKLNGLRYIV